MSPTSRVELFCTDFEDVGPASLRDEDLARQNAVKILMCTNTAIFVNEDLVRQNTDEDEDEDDDEDLARQNTDEVGQFAGLQSLAGLAGAGKEGWSMMSKGTSG